MKHRTAHIEYDASMPPEFKVIIGKLLVEFGLLIPWWCHRLKIEYSAEGTSCMKTNVQEEYRCGFIYIGPSWINQPDWKRREDVCHELVHLGIDLLHNVAFDLKVTLAEKHPDLKFYLDEQVRMAVERATSDLTHSIIDLLDEARGVSALPSSDSQVPSSAPSPAGQEPRQGQVRKAGGAS